MDPILAANHTFDQQPDNRSHTPAILIVDDEEDQRVRVEAICETISRETALEVHSVSSVNEALTALSQRAFHVILLDKNLTQAQASRSNGIDAIGDMLHLQPHVQILMVSADDSVEDVVLAMRNGAFGYVSKAKENALIRAQIEKALHIAKLVQEQSAKEHQAIVSSIGISIGGTSEVTRQLVKKLAAVAHSSEPVLLQGESGSGKTHAAKLIHNLRAHYLQQPGRPWVEKNIGEIPHGTAESVIFGHEKGAFTGAVGRKIGLLELANGGTLFFDEIGEIDNPMSVRLLRVSEGAPFSRMGGENKMLTSHFKLITATHQNLQKMVEEGRFRFDFYARISTFVVDIPPLRERREDIPDIIKALLPRCAATINLKCNYEDIPQDYVRYLTDHPPEENIRGIDKSLKRLLTLSHRDKFGIPIFTNWRSTLGCEKKIKSVTPQRHALTTRDLMTLPIELDASFPGFGAVIDSISNRMIAAASKKFKYNRDMAKVLKLSEAAISGRRKAIKSEKRTSPKNNNSAPTIEGASHAN